MPAVQALMIAASGFIVVFLMLVILWGLIELVSKVVTGIESRTEASAPVPAVKAEAPASAAEPAKPLGPFGGELALYDVDEKTAACLMAIVSDSTKIPLDQLIFKSIRALD